MPWERTTYEGDQGGQQQDSNQEVLELFQHKLPQGLPCEREHRMRAGILTNHVHAELRWPTPSLPFEWGEPEALRGKRGNAADSARPHSPGRGGHRLTVTGLGCHLVPLQAALAPSLTFLSWEFCRIQAATRAMRRQEMTGLPSRV